MLYCLHHFTCLPLPVADSGTIFLGYAIGSFAYSAADLSLHDEVCRVSPRRTLSCRRFETLLTKDELAGLACCPDVEARVVRGGRYVDNAGKDWEVQHGPFEEEVSRPAVGLRMQGLKSRHERLSYRD